MMYELTQKEVAIKCLEKLDVYKPYIRKFKSKAGTPCFFENYGGFYADQEKEICDKIREVENDHGCLVYAVTHEYSNMGETWSMLCVPKEVEPVDTLLFDAGIEECYYAFAYVWNKTVDHFSEFGDIIVRAVFGGVKRLA